MGIKITTERTHFYAPAINIVMLVTITGEPSEAELNYAIHKAVGKHDILRSRAYLDQSGDSFYSLMKKARSRIIMKVVTSADEWKQLIKEQERIPFHISSGDMIRYFLLKHEDEVQLVIVAHHLLGDGLSLIYFIRDIMKVLEDPATTYSRMPIKVLGKKDIPKNAKINPMIRLMMKLVNRKWNRNRKIFHQDEFHEMFESYWNKRETEIMDELFTGRELEKLIYLCKLNEVTVNSAIVTAFLYGVRVEKEVGLAVSIRPDKFEGMGNYVSGISIRYQLNNRKTFWENARKVQKLIYKKLNSNSAKYFLLQFLDCLEPTLVDAAYFSAFDGYENKSAAKVRDMFGYNRGSKGISITNLTRLDIPRTYGKYGINTIRFVPPLVPNAKRIIGIETIGEQMSVTLQYEKNETAQEKQEEFKCTMDLLRSL